LKNKHFTETDFLWPAPLQSRPYFRKFERRREGMEPKALIASKFTKRYPAMLKERLMLRSRSLIAAITCLALVSGSATALADPGNGKGNGNGNSQNNQVHGNQGGHANKGKNSGGGDWDNGPSINRAGVLGIVGGYRDYWSPGPALPPGIQKNLARGKPLPPGIAKKLDGRLNGRLPHYDGYEWQQAGTDLILVALATGLIYEVLNGAFD
jgi:hypothetical protein